MKILVSGAKGFTGKFFQSIAEAFGHKIVQLSSDLNDRSSLIAEVHEAQATSVLHLAAISSVTHSDEAAFYNVNVLGTMNLLEAIVTSPSPPSKVLLASSANVYGNCLESPIVETQIAAPVNHYATSKLAMEHMALTYVDRLPLIIARPFNYTGQGQTENFLIPKLVKHFERRAAYIELGNLDVEREFNDVRMVCEAYLRLLSVGEAGQIYNICSGQVYSLNQVLDLLSSVTSHDLEIRVNPSFVRDNEVRRLCGSPEKLLKCIGRIQSYSLEDTLKSMLKICS